jgi:hypothetical protein
LAPGADTVRIFIQGILHRTYNSLKRPRILLESDHYPTVDETVTAGWRGSTRVR